MAQHTLLQQKPWTFEGITRNLKLGVFTDTTREPEPPPNADLDAPAGNPDAPMLPPAEAPKRKLAEISGASSYRYKQKMPEDSNLPGASRPRQNWEEAEQAAMTALHMCEEAFFTTGEMPGNRLSCL